MLIIGKWTPKSRKQPGSDNVRPNIPSLLTSAVAPPILSRVGAIGTGRPPGFPCSQQSNYVETCTAVITGYEGEDFGIVRTNSQGNGIFHVDTVYICTRHHLLCKETDCPGYERFDPAKTGRLLRKALVVGQQVNLLRRPILHDLYKFQARLVWPNLSKMPKEMNGIKPEVSDIAMDHHLTNLLMKVTNSSLRRVENFSGTRRGFNNFTNFDNANINIDYPSSSTTPTPPPANSSSPTPSSAAAESTYDRCPLYREDDTDDYLDKMDRMTQRRLLLHREGGRAWLLQALRADHGLSRQRRLHSRRSRLCY
jgi:hypothetical protein